MINFEFSKENGQWIGKTGLPSIPDVKGYSLTETVTRLREMHYAKHLKIRDIVNADIKTNNDEDVLRIYADRLQTILEILTDD